MIFNVGDRVSMEIRHRGLGSGMGSGPVTKRRLGVVEAVLCEAPARYEIRWDRGNTSIYAPTLGELRLATEEEKAGV